MSGLEKADIMFIVSTVVMAIAAITLFTSCTFAEINIVQRATVSDGDGTSSLQHDATVEKEESSMKLVVPLK